MANVNFFLEIGNVEPSRIGQIGHSGNFGNDIKVGKSCIIGKINLVKSANLVNSVKSAKLYQKIR